ncbi:MAG TPA: alpha-ketoacid dehydrogenase subunit beta [Acidimicrobiia bacterium]
MTFVEATNSALDEAMAADDTVFLLGEDIADEEGGGVFKCTKGLSTKYGTSRVRSTPISEQAIVGSAIGSAIAGLRPVAEIMVMNFMAVCMDQLFNHAAKLRYMSGGRTPVPLTIRTTSGAGAQFGAQHSDLLEAWLAHTPGLKVAVPSSPADAKGLLLSCIFDDDPCVFVEHTLLYFGAVAGPAPEPGHRIPLGQANIVRPGTDVTVIGYGKPILEAQGVAATLAEDGIEVEIVDLRTIAPLDERTFLESVAKTKRAVVVHESVKRFGVGAEITARIHEELSGDLAAPVERVGAPHTPVPFSAVLEQAYMQGPSVLEAAIRKVVA